MKSMEWINVHTYLEDEVEFYEFLLKDKNVRFISNKIGLDGPEVLSLDEIIEMRKNGNKFQTVYIWNCSCKEPLCWSPYAMFYDENWDPIPQPPITGNNDGKPWWKEGPWWGEMSYERYLAFQRSFRSIPISNKMFVNGRLQTGLSPIIEMELPNDNNDYLGLTADFVDYIYDIWIEWDPITKKWIHPDLDIEKDYRKEKKKSIKCSIWQNIVISWVKRHWGKWIIPQFTKKYYVGKFANSSVRSVAQPLANLLEKPVAGISPQPPGISPRDQDKKDTKRPNQR